MPDTARRNVHLFRSCQGHRPGRRRYQNRRLLCRFQPDILQPAFNLYRDQSLRRRIYAGVVHSFSRLPQVSRDLHAFIHVFYDATDFLPCPIFNPVHDCGCFGDAIILTNWETFFKNVFVLLPASIATFIYCRQMTPVYTFKAYWFVIFFSYIFPVGFGFYNYINLPIIDFRPFKIGVNIPEKMSFPDDAPQNEYLYIYEKDGKKEAFTPTTAPVGDSTWTFVDAKLIKEGYVPPIVSFVLFDEKSFDVTDAILSDEKGVFLLIAPKISKASDKHIEEINNIYDYAVEHQMLFYAVTNSTNDEINEWINNTGADYPFLSADDVTLKTMIRSNPGLVLLKAGTILKKWHHNHLPSEADADAVIQGLLQATDTAAGKEKAPWLWIIGCFSLPLLLVWIYDYIRHRRKNEKEEKKSI